jgi:transcriptional regulator GlxA family with amidase domain
MHNWSMYDFTVLAPKLAFASSLAITLDVLASSSVMAPQLGVAPPRWRVVSAEGGWIALSNGLQIHTEPLARRSRPDRSTWIVPGLGSTSPSALSERLMQADATHMSKAIAAHLRQGGSVAASCSAVFLLERAGVLDGKTVTTTWWLAFHLKRLLIRGVVDAQRMVIADGNVITAGAAMAHTDLMLHLVRTRCGAALADAIARVMLIDARKAQAGYVIPSVLASGDELIKQLSASIEAALPNLPSIGELAAKMCMTERTLARHVVAATGSSPLALIQQVRLARAKALLERSRMSVERIAHEVGYRDATALRKMMKKALGATPHQLRLR